MRLNYSKGILSTLFTLAFVAIAFSQAVISGTVVDGNSLPVPNAEVSILGTKIISSTNSNGEFSVTSTDQDGVIEIYDAINGTKEIRFNAKDMTALDLGLIILDGAGVDLSKMVVVGKGIIDLEEDRRTPVAVSTVFKEEIQEKAQGNVEFPEILENTPNVYVSNQAGGFGDSKMFLRGFDQTNTAFLLNGQPINGMEDGKMYWSNWSGMTEIANAVQVQRGLGSSKLAISSVGGTINIVTKATEKKKGGYVQGLVGNDSYFKGAVGYNTGLSESGWAFSVALSHWQAHRKWARGTFGEGQNYFLSLGYKPNEYHNFNFLVTGAPQLHGQNFSKSLTGELSYETFGKKWNPNHGFLNGESFTWRQNYYHKPILNLNWDWNMSDNSSLSTVLYASFGRGGGTGPLGDTGKPYGDSAGTIDYFRGATQFYDENGDFKFDLLESNNKAFVTDGIGGFRRGLARRSSVNNHNWVGLVSNLNNEISEYVSLNIGFDGRMYHGDHFRQLTDLLGLNSYQDTYKRDASLGDNIVSATFSPTPWSALFDYADDNEKVAYNYSENINYLGGFGQIEYANSIFSTFFQGALSTQSYQREGKWADLGKSKKINKIGYNLKAGAAFIFAENNSVFANAGYYSRQPFLDNIFQNIRYSNDLISPEVENEEITGIEVGYKYQTRNLNVNLNAYYSKWDNRFNQAGGDDYAAANGSLYSNVTFLYSGIAQLHKGLELDFKASPYRNFDLRGYITYGDWEYDGETPYRVRDEDTGDIIETNQANLSGVKVGEAPQLTVGLGTDWDITNNLSWDVDLNFYGKFYGFVDVEDLLDAKREGKDYQVEKLNDYALINTGLTYNVKFGSQNIKFRGNVRNLFNHMYISQKDAYGYFYGNGRTWNASITYNF